MLICFASSTKVSFICVMHVLNGAQFLNAAFVSLPPEAIYPVAKICASELLQRLDSIELVKTLCAHFLNKHPILCCL